MAKSIYINLDANNLRSALVRSDTDLRAARFSQFVAGDSVDINLYTIENGALANIQNYSSVKVGIGGSDSRPNAGSYTIDSTNTLSYNHTAAELKQAIDSAVAVATVTELAPFVFKIQFTNDGAQTIPAVDGRLLNPRSTVDVSKMVTGDSTTPETWLWRLYRNPLAFTDTFTNISGNGITGTLDFNTSGIYDLISNEESEDTFLEIEVTDSSGAISTIAQIKITILGEVIGQSFNGTVPAPSSGLPASANAFLQSFPNPNFSNPVNFNGNTEFHSGVSFENSAQVEFQDKVFFQGGVHGDVDFVGGNLELSDPTGEKGDIQLSGGGDIILEGGKLIAGSTQFGLAEINSNNGEIKIAHGAMFKAGNIEIDSAIGRIDFNEDRGEIVGDVKFFNEVTIDNATTIDLTSNGTPNGTEKFIVNYSDYPNVLKVDATNTFAIPFVTITGELRIDEIAQGGGSKITLKEIQCVGEESSGTAQPITYDAAEHRFRDYDGSVTSTGGPDNLLVVNKFNGYTGARVAINNDPSTSKNVALLITPGKNASTDEEDLALEVQGGAFFEDFVRVGHYATAPSDAPVGSIIFNTTSKKFQGNVGNANGGWKTFKFED